jgi:predicted DNA-binding protein (MmcQ/YjbR family)
MLFDDIREYCLKKPETEETLPFDEETLVFKVCGKMFGLINITNPDTINLKCDPERALDLREHHPEIQAGWHMNKKHWNTVNLRGNLPSALVKELIDHSYLLVVNGLKKEDKKRILELIKAEASI